MGWAVVGCVYIYIYYTVLYIYIYIYQTILMGCLKLWHMPPIYANFNKKNHDKPLHFGSSGDCGAG